MSGRIAYAYQDGVATITMNDGKVNILSTAMLAEIGEAVGERRRGECVPVGALDQPGQQAGSTRGANGRRHESVFETQTLGGQPIHVRRLEKRV